MIRGDLYLDTRLGILLRKLLHKLSCDVFSVLQRSAVTGVSHGNLVRF